ncbi:EamA-like transporter family protein [Polaromonas sp. OV174]|uniref:DMT family transporter n=1 Tax=Polaromonas sp. OV174 TaxID=1855300 RepID=UPI0008EA29E9|nr:DMT family transporter [Polaromonas sp. OV174]SFC12350.1 EamA-like transporter family protein [Polaromonas sp. OV174]
MLTGIVAGLAAGALWGLVFVAPRMLTMGEGGYASVDLTAGRFAVYGLVAAAVMLLGLPGFRRRRLPTLRQAWAALGMSLLGFSGYYLLLVLAIRDAGTEVPTLIIGTIPLWIMLLGKPQGLRWAALLPGLALTFAGLLLMMGATHGASAGVATHFWRGIAFALMSLVCWTTFAILNSAWLKRHPEVNATDWANWLGLATGLGALLMWLVAGSDMNVLAARDDRATFALLCLMAGFGSTWLATILWNMASQRLSASLCGQLIVSETIFALLYSFAWDGHWPSLAQFGACVLFTLGILASIRAHR